MIHRTPLSLCAEMARRRGAIAVIAMIAILITVSIGLSLVRTALESRRQSLRWQQRTQARWLAEAGIERAAARLRQSADYEGETWKLSAEDLGGHYDGEVEIRLEATDENSGNYRLTVVADYPAAGEKRIRSRKTTTVAKQNTPDN